MLLLDLLVSIFVGKLLAALHGFHGFLCKFINVHNSFLLFPDINRSIVFCSICNITNHFQGVKIFSVKFERISVENLTVH